MWLPAMSALESVNSADSSGSGLCMTANGEGSQNDRNLSFYGNSVAYVTESIVCGLNIQPPPLLLIVNNSIAVPL